MRHLKSERQQSKNLVARIAISQGKNTKLIIAPSSWRGVCAEHPVLLSPCSLGRDIGPGVCGLLRTCYVLGSSTDFTSGDWNPKGKLK